MNPRVPRRRNLKREQNSRSDAHKRLTQRSAPEPDFRRPALGKAPLPRRLTPVAPAPPGLVLLARSHVRDPPRDLPNVGPTANWLSDSLGERRSPELIGLTMRGVNADFGLEKRCAACGAKAVRGQYSLIFGPTTNASEKAYGPESNKHRHLLYVKGKSGRDTRFPPPSLSC